MDIREFKENLIEEIKLNAVSELISDREAFVEYYTEELSDAEELPDFVALPFEGIGKTRKKIQIHGYAFDELDNCLSIVVCPPLCYYEDVTLTNTDAEMWFSRMSAFVEEATYIQNSGEESSPGYGFAIDIQTRYKNVNKYKLYIITDMSMSKVIREKAFKSGMLYGKPVDFNVWDITRLFELKSSASGKEDIVIDLKEFAPSGIPCLAASKTDDYTAYLCNIPGKILGELYNRHGGRLLEGNVRSFLTTRGKVNKGIRNTILNKPEMFFAYNNGIAATAYEIKTEKTDGVLHLTAITALQIVNGGQTTASLAATLKDDKDRANDLKNIFVPMKLSVVSPAKAQELIPNISRYANSQNKVSDADFFSNHAFHVRIEEFSRRVIAPAASGSQFGTRWYYERAKGQYKQEIARQKTDSEKKRFVLQNPKTQMFTKTDLAKYVNIYRMLPNTVSAGAQKNFLKFAEWAEDEWNNHDVVFGEGFYKRTIALAILFKETDKLVKTQDWYEAGYKANIIAYSLSLLFYTIKTRYPDKAFNFKNIWLRQRLSDALTSQVIAFAKVAYDFLISPNREVQNVTEWAKRENCWKKAKELELVLQADFVKELLNKETEIEDAKNDKKDQRENNKISAIIQVANYGVDFWKELIVWGTTNKVLNPIEIDFINTAVAMERGKMPSEKQCARVLEILDRARLESFPK